ncbi:hypothetical protein KC219_28545, partial [Mycobacterium tuberculosis]|nr:hypothetical protein [Mycobacterium tuberculosis]
LAVAAGGDAHILRGGLNAWKAAGLPWPTLRCRHFEATWELITVRRKVFGPGEGDDLGGDISKGGLVIVDDVHAAEEG